MCSGLLFALCMVVFFFGFACIIGGAFMSYQSAYVSTIYPFVYTLLMFHMRVNQS